MPGPRETWLAAAILFCSCGGGGETPLRSGREVTPVSTLPRAEAAVTGASEASEAGGDSEGSAGTAGTRETAGTTETETGTAGLEEELDQEPVAPPEYGLVHFAADPPAAEELTVHGLAGYEVVAIYSRPDMASDKLGYLRIGTRLMVTPKIDDPSGQCKKGFHGLPRGGFVCASKGWVVDPERPPFMQYEPPKPRLEEAHPYDYGYVRTWNTPMWWRVPTDDELKAADAQRALREAARTGVPVAPAKSSGEATGTGTGGDESGSGSGGGSDGSGGGSSGAESAAVDLAAIKLPLSPGVPWLERGYFLSLGEKLRDGGRTFFRTARGAFVSASAISGYKAKDFSGIALTDELGFPVAFVIAKSTKLLQLTDDDKLKAVATLDKRDLVDVTEETELRGKAYMITADGNLVRKDHLVIPDLQPLPKGLDPWERWVDVSLSKQLLVAYEGTRPVYVTLVSTGKKGSKDEPFDTPTGRWRIYSKHVSSTMDGNTASDGSYSIQDVPWTMFFYGSYALHGAFWHRSFGHVRSHGCVNLGPTDARWLFFWATPFLPEGWHGVHATDESPGTTVIVRE